PKHIGDSLEADLKRTLCGDGCAEPTRNSFGCPAEVNHAAVDGSPKRSSGTGPRTDGSVRSYRGQRVESISRSTTATERSVCLATARVPQDVENQFDAAGDTQLFVNPKQIIANSVFAEAELLGDVPVAESLSDQIGDLSLPLGEQISSFSIG